MPRDKRMVDKNKRYLFICAYGQSRSRYFAERFMERGIKALFCGYEKEADIKLNTNLLKWADTIIILDKYLYRDVALSDTIEFFDKKIIQFFIDDEPSEFKKLFNNLLTSLNNS